jgi:organic hydroperoxide reductase OsmC/OhrA
MHEYTAETIWLRGEQPFLDKRYSRKHVVRFDGGADLALSASPHVVPAPMSDPAAADPEELLVASLSSCHMLWFLSIAAQRRFRVDRYADQASGTMAKGANGKLFLSRITLRPSVSFSGERVPTREEVNAMHQLAHEECYIANSVRSEVVCEPVFASEPG